MCRVMVRMIFSVGSTMRRSGFWRSLVQYSLATGFKGMASSPAMASRMLAGILP